MSKNPVRIAHFMAHPNQYLARRLQMIAAMPSIPTDEVISTYNLQQGGENRNVVKTGDTNTLAEATLKIPANRERAEQMGVKSPEIIKEWSLERDISELKNALRYFFADRVQQARC